MFTKPVCGLAWKYLKNTGVGLRFARSQTYSMMNSTLPECAGMSREQAYACCDLRTRLHG